MLILPPIPDSLADLRPLRVGAAARLAFGGGALHQPPELWVRATPDRLRARCPEAVAGSLPDQLRVGGWDVRAVEDVEAALIARAVPIDAFAVGADGAVIDPLDGVADLRAGALCWSGTFTEDPSLLVQVIALASELALRVPAPVLEIIGDQAGLVLRADRDRLREALTRLLVGRRPSAALNLLATTGLLRLVLPEAAALIDFHRSSRHHHKDVWQHTRQVVMQAVPRVTVRWAALLHDIGKAHTRSYSPGKKVHFLLHDELGAVMCEGVAARLRFEPAFAARVGRLVRLHLRPNLYDPAWSDAAIRRFANEAGPELEELLLLSRADVTSRRPGRRRQAMYALHDLETRIASVRAADAAARPRVPKGLGTAIIRDLGVPPGPEVGNLRKACEDAVRSGALPPEPDVATCIEFLRRRRAAA